MSSGTIRKYMDLLNSASKPTQLNESEDLAEAKESWVGRRVADRFAAEIERDGTPISPVLWWLGTIVDDNGNKITVNYDNTVFNDPKEYTLTGDKSYYTRANAFKRGQVVVKDDTPSNPNGLSDEEIAPLIAPQDYVRPGSKLAQPSATKPQVNAATPPSTGTKLGTVAPGNFKLTPQDLKDLEEYARQGDRIMADGKAIYAGFGNRSGLHSYLSTVLADTFKKWPRAKAKLEAGAFDMLEVMTFRNINRDRGNWMRVRSFKNAKVGESVIGEETSQERAAATAAYQKEREIQSLVYEKSGKNRGEGFNDPQQMISSFNVRYPQGFVQKDSAILGSEASTTLWDKEGSGAKVVGVWVHGMKYGFMV